MQHSWQMYLHFLNKYFDFMRVETFYIWQTRYDEVIIWKDTNYNVTHWSHNIKKTQIINQYLRPRRKSKSYQCVLMLVWNKYYPKWIRIPCDKPILDKASLFCVNNTIIKHFTVYSSGISKDAKRLSMNDNFFMINNTFLCSNFCIDIISNIM